MTVEDSSVGGGWECGGAWAGSNVSDDEDVDCGGVSKRVAWWEGEVRWW